MPLATGSTLPSTKPASSAAPSPTPRPSDPASRVAALFTDKTAGLGITGETPGCSVAISDHGSVVYADGFGLADLVTRVPISPTTLMEVGSTSKQFTAASILLLAGDGKLSLDDDIHRHVPELPAYGKLLPLRDLLWMESGLPEWFASGVLAPLGYTIASRLSENQIVHVIATLKPLDFAPGSQYAYRGTNYFLLRLIVERVSGESLAAFERSRIFDPLGMASTESRGDLLPPPPGAATSYAIQSDYTLAPILVPWDAQGQSGVWSNVLDLLRWAANFTTGTVGGPAFLNAQVLTGPRPVPLDSASVVYPVGSEGRYAAGLFLSSHAGQPLIWHNGYDEGYRSGLLIQPETGRAAAVTCNSVVASDGFDLALRALEAWFGT